MEPKADTQKQKLRVAKTGIFILICVLLERYSTGGIACEFNEFSTLNKSRTP